MKMEIMRNNHYILRHYDLTVFQSYNTPIIRIDYKNNIISVFPDYCYSTTTSRNRNEFLRLEGFKEIATTKSLNKAIRAGEILINGEKYKVEKLDGQRIEESKMILLS